MQYSAPFLGSIACPPVAAPGYTGGMTYGLRMVGIGIGTGLVLLLLFRTVSVEAPVLSGAEFGGVSLRIEYATTTVARERGLSGRSTVPEDYGMLFVFVEEGKYGFWMKDMLVPIDIFWLDSQGQVVWVEREITPATYPNVFYPPVPVRYVLETVAGFASLHHIATGTLLELKNPPTVSE